MESVPLLIVWGLVVIWNCSWAIYNKKELWSKVIIDNSLWILWGFDIYFTMLKLGSSDSHNRIEKAGLNTMLFHWCTFCQINCFLKAKVWHWTGMSWCLYPTTDLNCSIWWQCPTARVETKVTLSHLATVWRQITDTILGLGMKHAKWFKSSSLTNVLSSG